MGHRWRDLRDARFYREIRRGLGSEYVVGDEVRGADMQSGTLRTHTIVII